MGFKLRKSIKLLPGVKLNLSKEGISSVSIGKRGATVNINEERGTDYCRNSWNWHIIQKQKKIDLS